MPAEENFLTGRLLAVVYSSLLLNPIKLSIFGYLQRSRPVQKTFEVRQKQNIGTYGEIEFQKTVRLFFLNCFLKNVLNIEK